MNMLNDETLEALDALNDPGQVSTFDLRTVAEALGLDSRTVKTWADGPLKTVQLTPGGKRYVQLEELQNLARNGWSIDVQRLLDVGASSDLPNPPGRQQDSETTDTVTT